MRNTMKLKLTYDEIRVLIFALYEQTYNKACDIFGEDHPQTFIAETTWPQSTVMPATTKKLPISMRGCIINRKRF